MNLYDASVPSFVNMLQALEGIIDEAPAWAGAAGIEESHWVDAKLAPDMFDLKRQVQIFCDLALKGCERLAGKEPQSIADTETTAAELKARIARTIKELQALDRTAFEGAESRTIVLPMPSGKISFPARVYLFEFVIPNFYFHASMFYANLRALGMPVSKQHFLAGLKSYFEAEA